MDWIKSLLEAPIKTILVVAGLAFIITAVVGKLSSWVELNQRWQRWLVGILGVIFLIIGISQDMNLPSRKLSQPPTTTSPSIPTLTNVPPSTVFPNNSPPITSPPTNNNLSGRWKVSHQGKSGFSISHWDITLRENTLSIVDFYEAVQYVPLPGDYRKELKVSNFRFNNPNISFTTESDNSITTEYNLAFTSGDKIQGSFRSIDTFLQDNMGLGTIQDEGKVIMTREK